MSDDGAASWRRQRSAAAEEHLAAIGRRNRSVGVGTDARFYVLSAPGSLAARLAGVVVASSPAPLVVGAGARDGESVPLETLLALRLDAADDWAG